MNQDTAARHITRLMRSQFVQNANGAVSTDPISGNPIPTRFGIQLGQQDYNARSMAHWRWSQSREGRTPTVPHTRVPLTDEQDRAIDLADRANHPIRAFRRREVILGALKHYQVTDFIESVVDMANLVASLRWTIASGTIESKFTRMRLISFDKCAAEIGYRLQVLRTSELGGEIEILPYESFSSLCPLPVTRFQTEGYYYSFFLVPISMQYDALNAHGDSTKQGVVTLSRM